jgi:hypothetical protein
VTNDRRRSSGRTRIEKQAAQILDRETKPVELAGRLDFGYVQHNDRYADWHASTPLLPMVRALFLKGIAGYTVSEVHRHLEHTPEDARALGFESVPARTTFGRTWRDRFDEDLRDTIEYNARRVRELAYERGNSLGSQAIEPENKGDVSKRTENRFIDEKSMEVIEEMQHLAFPAFDFGRADNAHYDRDAFLELQSHMGLSNSAAESGTDLFDDDTTRETGAPDADTHLYNIKRLDRDEIEEMIDDGISRMVNEAKHYLEFDRPVEVAIDMTYVAYYGERDELEMVMGTPDSKSYDWCYKFATLTVVGENIKFTLAMRPVEKVERVGEVVRDLYWTAYEHVTISTIYADAEFCSVDVIRACEEAGVKYLIPSPRTARVKRFIRRMDNDVAVEQGYTMHGPALGGATNEPGTTNLVAVPSSSDPEKTVAFITNKDVDDEIGLDRRSAKNVVDRYSRRWGIENSYKTIKDFLAWTTSKSFEVRLFYFGFAVLLYDMWLLVDLLVQMSLDIEHRYKPRVTAKRFLNIVRKHLRPGG